MTKTVYISPQIAGQVSTTDPPLDTVEVYGARCGSPFSNSPPSTTSATSSDEESLETSTSRASSPTASNQDSTSSDEDTLSLLGSPLLQRLLTDLTVRSTYFLSEIDFCLTLGNCNRRKTASGSCLKLLKLNCALGARYQSREPGVSNMRLKRVRRYALFAKPALSLKSSPSRRRSARAPATPSSSLSQYVT